MFPSTRELGFWISGAGAALVCMAAGTRYAPHRHEQAEEVYVLEGSCLCGGRLLRVGDYHRAEGATVHTDTSTEEGCLMLAIFSPHNQILG